MQNGDTLLLVDTEHHLFHTIMGVTVSFYVHLVITIGAVRYAHYRFYMDKQQQTVTKQMLTFYWLLLYIYKH